MQKISKNQKKWFKSKKSDLNKKTQFFRFFIKKYDFFQPCFSYYFSLQNISSQIARQVTTTNIMDNYNLYLLLSLFITYPFTITLLLTIISINNWLIDWSIMQCYK